MQTIDEEKEHCRVVGEGIAEYHAAKGRREAIARRVRLSRARILARGSRVCTGSRSALRRRDLELRFKCFAIDGNERSVILCYHGISRGEKSMEDEFKAFYAFVAEDPG